MFKTNFVAGWLENDDLTPMTKHKYKTDTSGNKDYNVMFKVKVNDPSRDPRKRRNTTLTMVSDRWASHFPVGRRSVTESAGGTASPCGSPIGSQQEANLPLHIEHKFDQILAKLDMVVNSVKLNQDGEHQKKKWQNAAHIIDKMFFWVLTVTVMVVTTVMFFMIPKYDD